MGQRRVLFSVIVLLGFLFVIGFFYNPAVTVSYLPIGTIEDFFSTSVEKDIKGFSGMRWGISRKEIHDNLGRPTSSKQLDDEVLTRAGYGLFYEGQKKFGFTGNLILVVHPDVGLEKGIFKFPVDNPKECLVPFEKMSGKIREKYPDLEENTSKANELEAPFCNALQLEQAQIVRHWRDSENSAKIVMTLGLFRKDTITVFGESNRAYGSWFEFRNP